MKESIRLDLIITDGGTQPRAELDISVVAEYVEAMANGAQFPPVTLFYDGTAYWLADGFHRVSAAKISDKVEISADVISGTRRDAILFSVGANDTHGLRRTNEDKRRAVETLLNDPEWSAWSDREIARRCGVGHPLVSQLRESLTGRKTSEKVYTTRHGTRATMHTENIGKKQEPEEEYVFEDEDTTKNDRDYTFEDIFEKSMTPEYVIEDIMRYAESTLRSFKSLSDQHMIVNEILKRFRTISIEFNQKAYKGQAV